MREKHIYWGILCNKCSEPVAFGSPSNSQFEVGTSHARPGRIRCSNGHTSLYFPRDFTFFASSEIIPESVMQANCAAHAESSPMAVVPIGRHYGTRWVPDQEPDTNFPDMPRGVKAVPANPGADVRRQTARESAKHWWAAWAVRKVS